MNALEQDSMEPLDCGDHSCDFAKDRSGMRTNGGCRCLKPMVDTQRSKVKAYIKHIELQVNAYRGSKELLMDKVEAMNRLNGEMRDALVMADSYLGTIYHRFGSRMPDDLMREIKTAMDKVRSLTEKRKCPKGHAMLNDGGPCYVCGAGNADQSKK